MSLWNSLLNQEEYFSFNADTLYVKITLRTLCLLQIRPVNNWRECTKAGALSLLYLNNKFHHKLDNLQGTSCIDSV